MRTTHPYLTRFAHWLGAVSLVVLGASGLQILQAFPSFGTKLPPSAELAIPAWLGLGGWLGGALAWHFTFGWLFAFSTGLYVIDLARGGWRRLWLSRTEWRGIWPMARHYFLRGPKPPLVDLYNPLQKTAYLFVTGALLLAVLTGSVLAQPVQLSFILRVLGGWQAVRILHFLCLCAFGFFLPGHLVMVALAGKPAMHTMITGRSPVEAQAEVRSAETAVQ